MMIFSKSNENLNLKSLVKNKSGDVRKTMCVAEFDVVSYYLFIFLCAAGDAWLDGMIIGN